MASYDTGASIFAHQLKNYHDRSKLESYDLVQGVTITFKDNLDETKTE